jgi:hypothetical protein
LKAGIRDMQEQAMSESTSSAFISYHHDDRIIGETLKDQLEFLATRGNGRTAVSSFLDAKDIPHGANWKQIINQNLVNMDWLIVVFTGEQSVYCGYEIGTFSQLHAQSPVKRIMGLYDVDKERLPAVLKDSQNTFVTNVENVSDPRSALLRQSRVDIKSIAVREQEEVDYWYSSEVGKFLFDFSNYKGLYTPEHERNRPADYSSNIARAAKSVATAFALARGTDVKSETPTQIGFELTIKGIGDGRIEKIPENSTIISTSLFFDLLDLRLELSWNRAPNTTWGKLKGLLANTGRRDVPWMHKVESDVVRAVDSRNVSPDDVTIRGANGKVYRPILERHKLFVNGDRRFYVLFVETLDRRFVGSRRSSLLLASLILASRWHFSYFEKWSDTQRIFGEKIPLQNLADSCKQLFYNIEWIELEAAQLGTDDPRAMIEAFGQDHRARVERFFSDWEKAKKDLFAVLPGLDTEITEANQKAARAAVLDFLEKVKSQNEDFLELAIKAYSDEVKR